MRHCNATTTWLWCSYSGSTHARRACWAHRAIGPWGLRELQQELDHGPFTLSPLGHGVSCLPGALFMLMRSITNFNHADVAHAGASAGTNPAATNADAGMGPKQQHPTSCCSSKWWSGSGCAYRSLHCYMGIGLGTPNRKKADPRKQIQNQWPNASIQKEGLDIWSDCIPGLAPNAQPSQKTMQ